MTTDIHYNDRIQAHIRAEAYSEGVKAGRREFKGEVCKVVESCLVADPSLAKLLEQIRGME